MLMIRLQRVGRVHEPVFRLVLTDSKNGPKSGKFLEILGNFDTRKSEKAELKVEEIKKWISKGAQLSTTVHNMLLDKKIISGKKINALPKKTAAKKADSAESSVEPKEETKTEVAVQEEAKQEKVPATEVVAENTEIAEEKKE